MAIRQVPARGLLRLSMAAASLAAMVMLVSCLPVGLGDPSKAAADSRFLGAWQWKDAERDGRSNIAVFRAWDDHTFIVDVLSYGGELSAPVPKGRLVFKAWLASVKGKTFLNLQQIEMLSPLDGEKHGRYFLIAKVELSGDQLTATGLDGGFDPFKAVNTTTDLEKVVAQNMDDVKMWIKPIVATRLPADQVEAMEKLAKKYEGGGD